MITFDQFITKYLGKMIDFDGAFQGQCVDLYRQYIQDVLGFQQPRGVSGAKDFWTNYDTDPNLKNLYEKIPNTPTGVPQKGDVMLWNAKAGGGFGHVSVFIQGDVNKFTSFDQNWPTLSKCTKTVHDYKNVYGWLRPKKAPVNPNPDALQSCLEDHVKLVDQIEKDLKPTIVDLTRERDAVEGELNQHKDQQKTLADKLGCENQFTVIAGKVDELITIEKQYNALAKEHEKATDTITENYVEDVQTTVFPPAEPQESTPTPSSSGKSFLESIIDFILRKK